jgi:hypothetical protein
VKRAFAISKWLHKYLGLVLILFLTWMSLSGVLMNHPDLISGISVPGWMVPGQYHIRNWNRSALVALQFSRKDPDIAFAAGNEGVWKTDDGGKTFTAMPVGFSASPYYRKTRSLLLLQEKTDLLFAGTDEGLYVCDPREEKWHRLRLGKTKEPVKKILQIRNQLLVFTSSHAYLSPLPPSPTRFTQIDLPREDEVNTVSLVKLFFDLHYGKAWGLPGLLLFDATGLIVLFLSTSAFYTWYFPWKRKRLKKESKLLTSTIGRKVFKTMFKYHLKFGIWIAAVLLIIGGTGLFMRPPLLAALVNGEIPADYYPGFLPDNPWLEKIQNALYDAVEDRIIIQTTDGFWIAPADFSEPFQKEELNVPVFVMGSTVFEPYGTGGFLVGSFNGIFHLERATGNPIDLFSNELASNVSGLRPAERMVTGYFRTPRGEEFITAHGQGLLPVGNARLEGRFEMPGEITKAFRMPLWNYLFEIHNGRFFREWIGNWYILIVPLGSLLFVLITLTGVYDWLHLNLFRKHFAGRMK